MEILSGVVKRFGASQAKIVLLEVLRWTCDGLAIGLYLLSWWFVLQVGRGTFAMGIFVAFHVIFLCRVARGHVLEMHRDYSHRYREAERRA